MDYKSIKELRKSKKLTQAQLSDILGISERNYRAKESGRLPFTQLEMMHLIKIFNLHEDEFYKLFYINAFKNHFWRNQLIRYDN